MKRALLLLCFCTGSALAERQMQDLRLWSTPQAGRIELLLSGPELPRFEVHPAPGRLVIELLDTRPAAALPKMTASPGLVNRLRQRQQGPNLLIELQLAGPLHATWHSAAAGDDQRLAIELDGRANAGRVGADSASRAAATRADRRVSQNAAPAARTVALQPAAGLEGAPGAQTAISTHTPLTHAATAQGQHAASARGHHLGVPVSERSIPSELPAVLQVVRAQTAANPPPQAPTRAVSVSRAARSELKPGPHSAPGSVPGSVPAARLTVNAPTAPAAAPAPSPTLANTPAEPHAASAATARTALPVQKAAARTASRPWVIAIDPGHGGDKPGAVGPGGTQEKDVTLAIGRRLAQRLNALPNFKAVLTRTRDVDVSLRGRLAIARQARADLFVSVHADASPTGRGRGASVYALSERGATGEAARWLAARMNADELSGGVHLSDHDPSLASVLFDLSQAATEEASLRAGAEVLKRMQGIGRLFRHDVQQANFVVLRSPDIPSILVECAFISHPAEEQQLADRDFQDRLAGALAAGIAAHFENHSPAPVRVAAQPTPDG